MPSTCGTCTLCCRLTAIPELSKPINEWCKFCKVGKGCMIYDNRPPSCQKFECVWLRDSLPAELRPDRCKVIFEPLPGCSIYLILVTPGRSGVWKSGKINHQIQQFLKSGISLVVQDGGEKYIMLAEGMTKGEVVAEVRRVMQEYGVMEWQHRPIPKTSQISI